MQLASIGCPNEESYRRELREMLFTSPGIDNYISGVVRGTGRVRMWCAGA
jgi:fructose-bisphosphate aldolase class 1